MNYVRSKSNIDEIAKLRKYWVPILLGISLTFGLISTFEVLGEIGEPFGGFYAYRNHAWNFWRVEASTPPWWLERTPLAYDDVLIAIDSQPYDHHARGVYGKAQQEGRDEVQITVERSGELIDLNVKLQPITLSVFADIKLPDIINGFGFWWLALVVYRAKPENQINRIFALTTSLTAASIWLSIPSIFPESTMMARLNAIGWVIVTSFIGVFFIHLSFVFPIIVRPVIVRWIWVLYIVMIFVACGFALSLILRWQNHASNLMANLSRFGNTLSIGLVGLGVAIFLLRLAWLITRRILTRREQRQVVFLFLGVAYSLPYIVVVVMRVISQTSVSYFLNGLDLRYLVLGVPFSFAFVILRYQTFQSPHPSLVGVFMLAISALFASLGAWIIRLIEPTWANSLNVTTFIPIFFAAILSGIFWSAQSTWFGFFSRLFNWEHHSYEAVQKFTHQTVGEIDLNNLPSAITQSLVKNLELERVALWLWNESKSVFELASVAGEQSLTSQVIPGYLDINASRLIQNIIRMTGDLSPIPEWLTPLDEKKLFEVVAPLNIHERPVGLLGLGKRWDEEIFDQRDIVIVEMIAQQAAFFLLTAVQIEQLRQVPHQIANAQERERFKIAQELHDTIQQFLGSLPFYLEIGREAIYNDPDEATTVLERCMVEVKTAARTVRQIRNNLAPMHLEKGTITPLETLVEHFCSRTGIKTAMEIDPATDLVLSPGARHALYRVVQQALDNVATHANASKVKLSFTLQGDHLQFVISDDGCGSSDEKRAKAIDDGSFGLTSMRARVVALGGKFFIDSAPGKGTQIYGWLPTK